MIIVKLQGGLGNQMFQYAVARGIAKKSEKIYLDHTALEENNQDTAHFTARKYELCIFKKLKAKPAGSFLLKLSKSTEPVYRRLRRFYQVKIIWQRENEYVDFPKRSFFENLNLDGYFQSEKYFKHIRNHLIEEFSFPGFDERNEAIKLQIKRSINTVALHVRRGDYLKSDIIKKVHGILPVSYYNEAIFKITKEVGDIEVFVFSDDIDWCRSNLKLGGNQITYVTGNVSIESWKDMALMKECRHHIIANSSFSWWGAWLSQGSGMVYAPSRWFNPENVRFDINDFIPSNWHILDVA